MADKTSNDARIERTSKGEAQLTADGRREWLREAWRMWLGPVAGIVTVAALIALYVFDFVREVTFSWILFGGVAVLAWGLPALAAAVRCMRGTTRVVSLLLGLAWMALCAWPVQRGLAPGRPQVEGFLTRGQVLTVPAEFAHGGFDVMLGGREALAAVPRGVDVKYGVAVQPAAEAVPHTVRWLSGSLVRAERGLSQGGGGRRVEVLHAADRYAVEWPRAEAVALRLTSLAPDEAVGLTVEVRAGLFPVWLVLAALGLAAAGAVALDTLALRRGVTTLLPHAALAALLFVVQLRADLTPDAPVKPLFVWLLTSLIGGAVAGAVVQWLIKRRVAPPKPLSTRPQGSGAVR